MRATTLALAALALTAVFVIALGVATAADVALTALAERRRRRRAAARAAHRIPHEAHAAMNHPFAGRYELRNVVGLAYPRPGVGYGGCTCPRHANLHGTGAPGRSWGERPFGALLWLVDLHCPIHRAVAPEGRDPVDAV